MSVKFITKRRQSIAEFITDAIAASPKSQREVADNMNLDNANLITMWKNGSSRVPLDRLHSLALALNVDAWFLVRLALLEYYPNLHRVIEKVMPAPVLTSNEKAMLESFRQATDYSDPEFRFHNSGTKIVASYSANTNTTA
jgi:transcriptional regulator with XRE-family HTH domain